MSSFFRRWKVVNSSCAVAVLAMLISKVLQKARKLSAKLIYKELKRQNEIIFEAEKERNTLKFERDDLKGLARFTKKGELQSKIDRKNEEIDILKLGLSGIVKRYGYQNVQEFYHIYHKSHIAYADYQKKISKWEENYGNKSTNDSVHKRIQNYQKAVSERQLENITKKKDRGAR